MRKSRVKIGNQVLEYQYSILTRAQIRKLVSLEDEWLRCRRVIEFAVQGLPDPDDLPFGIVSTIARKVLQASTPSLEEVLEASREKVQDPGTVQEMLIATAWPEYTFAAQESMTVEEWVEAWVRTEWKLVAIMGVEPKTIESMLSPPEVAAKKAAFDNAKAIMRGADGHSVDAQKAQQQYAPAVERALERIKQRGVDLDGKE